MRRGQGLHGVTIMVSAFLSTSLNIQGVNAKLMVTFALHIRRKKLRLYPLFSFLDLVLKNTATITLVF